MKITLKQIGLLTVGLSLMATSVSQARGYFGFFQQPSQTITEIVAASGGEFDRNHRDYDILLNAVLAAGLEGALANPEADLTVLAPNDRAFIRLARDLGFEGHDEEGAFNAIVAALTELGGGDPIPVITNVLLYHVSPGSQGIRKLATAGKIETLLEGGTIATDYITLVDNEHDVANPRFIYPVNLRATNGIIQTINRVLIPLDLPGNSGEEPTQSIVDIVAASEGVFDRNRRDYDILLNAVIAANLVDALANPEANLTVFAPNDAAFIRLARDLGYRGRDEAGAFNAIVEALTELGGGDPIPVLTNVLLYHVSPEAKTVKQVADLEEVTTLLEGATLQPWGTFLVDAAEQLRSPRINLRRSNIGATNGTIHTLNRVLIPVDIAPVRRRH